MKENVKYYPLTHPQLGIWYTEKLYPGTSIGNIAGTLKLKGNIDYSLLKKAIEIYVENTDTFRLHFAEINGEPKQYYSKLVPPKIEVYDFSSSGKEALYKWDTNRTQLPFQLIDSDLYEFCIFKLSETDAGVYIKLHHLICDGWSIVHLSNDICKIYFDLCSEKYEKFDATPSYSGFIEDEDRYIKSEKIKKDRLFWNEIYSSYPEITTLKIRKTNSHNTKSKRKSFVLPARLSKKIMEFCSENRTSIFLLFFTALSIYINRVSDKEDIIIGVPVLNRSNITHKKMIGMFINTLPIRISVNTDMNFADFLDSATKEWMKALKHHKYSYDLIVNEVREKYSGINDLYDITLSYQNAKITKEEEVYSEGRWHFCGHQKQSLNIHINDRENDGTIAIDYDYLVDVFYAKEIDFIHDHIIRILWHALDNPCKTVAKLDMVSEKEKNKILFDFNNTASDYPKDKNIIRLFEEQVEKAPHNCAVRFNNISLTYEKFNRRVNEIAWTLIESGVNKGDIIAVMIPRNLHALVSIYAILKCGAVFLPIDTAYPHDRIIYMLNDSQPKVILYEDVSIINKIEYKCNWINVSNCISLKNNNPRIYPYKDSNAYIIYTSGSTGKPKGAMITNKGLVNYIYWANKVYLKGDNITFPLHSSLSFDLTITSIFTPLISGNTIIIYSDDNALEPPIIRVFTENNVDIVKLTPAHLSLVKDIDNSNSRIKRLIVGGEDLKTELARQVYSSFCGNVEIYNEYGPTETVVGCMIYKFNYESDSRVSVPIGKPADNVSIYILDKHLNPVPIGAPGELCIGGDGVCAGYLNNPDLTSKKFITNPFIENQKMYKSGDLARWFPQGDIECLGRIDDQVKIKGYRVELGEIETQLLSHEEVSSAVVMVFDDKDRKKYLCAYVILSSNISENDLRIYLARRLPAYMIPTHFIILDKIPLTQNGKVDKRRLPKPQNKLQHIEYTEPSNEIERIIANAIQDVSGLNKVGVYDNFNDLGIDSLDIIRIQAKILKYNWKISTQDFYEYPNIQLLSHKVSNKIEFSGAKHEGYAKIRTFSPVLFSNNNSSEGNILLTGCTGFLGAHLLNEIISNSSVNVYCLVRENGHEKALHKLMSKLDYYFTCDYRKLINKRIHVVNGDFTLNNLGLSDNDYKNLGRKLKSIIHSGALVKHYGDTRLFEKTNVFGTEQIADFAEQFGIQLNHISTTSIAGQYDDSDNIGKEFFESDIYVGQRIEDKIYIKTKFLAEQIIVNRVLSNNLNANIFRIGNLTGRYSDGVFQENSHENLFNNRINSIIKYRSIPKEIMNIKVDLTPVDFCCSAIQKIMINYSDRADIYHLYNTNTLRVSHLIQLLNNIGKPIEVVDLNEYTENIKKLYEKNINVNLLYSFINEMNDNMSIRNTVKINADKTLELLYKVGFRWPVCDENYINKIFGDITEDNNDQKGYN